MKSPIIEKLESKIAKLKQRIAAKDALIVALEQERLELRQMIRRAARPSQPGRYEK